MTPEYYNDVIKNMEEMNNNLKKVSAAIGSLACSSSNCNESNNGDDWLVPIIGCNLTLPADKLYVYVKVRSIVKRDLCYPFPHVATYENGRWYTQDGHIPYGSDEFPYEVILWKHIPGEDVF